MKKIASMVLIVTLSLLVISFIGGQRGIGQPLPDFNAYRGLAIPDASIDGTIGTEWDDAGQYTNVAIDPSGTADIWTKNDGTNLYIAIRFTADNNNPWLALQLGADTCMDNSADVVIFGDDNLNATGYTDAFFDSGSSAAADTTQNGVGAMTVTPVGNVVTIELRKPLNSGDATGRDIAWADSSTNNMVIAWDSNGNGSGPGGTANHKVGTTPTGRKIFINPNVIPEFPGWTFVAVLLILSVPLIVVAKKLIFKPAAPIRKL